MFTQRDEEPYILKHFENTIGRFLDIGAHNGELFSTTRALALKGWGGVCIEPSPIPFRDLKERYKDSSEIEVLQIAIVIGNQSGTVDFYDSRGDMISSVDPAHVKLWQNKANVAYDKIQVCGVTVSDLFEMIGHNFDFISLDVEGTNVDIIKEFPFAQLTKTTMICVEFDHQERLIMELVKPYGYTLLHKTAENLLLVR